MSNNTFLKEDDIKTYNIRDLHNKTLKMRIVENDKQLILLGEDETGKIYIMAEEYK